MSQQVPILQRLVRRYVTIALLPIPNLKFMVATIWQFSLSLFSRGAQKRNGIYGWKIVLWNDTAIPPPVSSVHSIHKAEYCSMLKPRPVTIPVDHLKIIARFHFYLDQVLIASPEYLMTLGDLHHLRCKGSWVVTGIWCLAQTIARMGTRKH